MKSFFFLSLIFNSVEIDDCIFKLNVYVIGVGRVDLLVFLWINSK